MFDLSVKVILATFIVIVICLAMGAKDEEEHPTAAPILHIAYTVCLVALVVAGISFIFFS